ncbi:MAG TPA: DUF503 family protein [Oligoflexia bacterium]|nr:DUF503 family protein [Oligoflexia bacterium]
MYVGVAKVILDFHGNVEIKTKRFHMRALLEELRKKFEVSAVELADFDDCERCVLGFSVTQANEKSAKAALAKILEHIDQTAFARVTVEDSDVLPFDIA